MNGHSWGSLPPTRLLGLPSSSRAECSNSPALNSFPKVILLPGSQVSHGTGARSRGRSPQPGQFGSGQLLSPWQPQLGAAGWDECPCPWQPPQHGTQGSSEQVRCLYTESYSVSWQPCQPHTANRETELKTIKNGMAQLSYLGIDPERRLE